MLSFLKALWRGWKILTKNYVDVVSDIDKQTYEHSKIQSIQVRADVYNYLQRLLKLHIELFSSTWTVILAFLSLIISIVSLIVSVKK